MRITVLKSKLHRIRVTAADLEYEGSLTLDPKLMDAAALHPFEKISVANLRNGERFETYVIRGESGSGEVCVNGAAARLASPGDELIVMSYATIPVAAAVRHRPNVVLVDDANRIQKGTKGRAAPDGRAASKRDWL